MHEADMFLQNIAEHNQGLFAGLISGLFNLGTLDEPFRITESNIIPFMLSMRAVLDESCPVDEYEDHMFWHRHCQGVYERSVLLQRQPDIIEKFNATLGFQFHCTTNPLYLVQTDQGAVSKILFWRSFKGERIPNCLIAGKAIVKL